MRTKKLAVVVFALALLSATTFSVTGQQEALPAVQPRASASGAEIFEAGVARTEPTIFLAAYPIMEYRPPTLAEAARNNDYVSFDALYTDMKRRGENVDAWTTLHELWTYSITDPIGAFYGVDMHQRLARAYPGFAEYIAQYMITDSNGNSFWPASETRAFLTDRAMAGDASKVLLADQAQPRETRRATVGGTTTPRTSPRLGRSRSQAPARKPAARTRVQKAAVEETPAPAKTVVEAPPPVVVADAQASAPVQVETEPAPTPQVEPKVTETATAAQMVPAATPPAVAVPPATRDGALANRGILLLVLGLIGIGLLALILRTPKEDRIASMAIDKRAPVEPIRKAGTPPAEPRANGSPGSAEHPQHFPSSPDRSRRDEDARGLRR